MENNRIKHLLEKYFEGQSTLAEEQELVEYFSGNHEFPDSLVHFFRHVHQGLLGFDISKLRISIGIGHR